MDAAVCTVAAANSLSIVNFEELIGIVDGAEVEVVWVMRWHSWPFAQAEMEIGRNLVADIEPVVDHLVILSEEMETAVRILNGYLYDTFEGSD